jgi:hypothetical protein
VNRQFSKDAVGWGFALWLIGYALGVVLFAFVPTGLIGWMITPFATALTLWVAFKQVKGSTLQYLGFVGLVWLLIALAGDYFFIVKTFKPADGYYKAYVYLYYVLTLAIPLLAGWRRHSARAQ